MPFNAIILNAKFILLNAKFIVSMQYCAAVPAHTMHVECVPSPELLLKLSDQRDQAAVAQHPEVRNCATFQLENNRKNDRKG